MSVFPEGKYQTHYPVSVRALGLNVPAARGFIVLCPNVNPEPYVGDGDAYNNVMRFAYDLNSDPASVFYRRIHTNSIGLAGYSLGGGRVMRG
jgi:hypothetical protein